MNGVLYGTTFDGGGSGCQNEFGIGCGTVFGVDASTDSYRIIYRFKGGDEDGATPLAGLIADASGTLYGTTSGGGNVGCNTFSSAGCGTVFEVKP